MPGKSDGQMKPGYLSRFKLVNLPMNIRLYPGCDQGLLNSYYVGSKESYLLSFKELFLNGIMQPPESSLNTVSVSFCMFPCSKGHLLRAYLDTI